MQSEHQPVDTTTTAGGSKRATGLLRKSTQVATGRASSRTFATHESRPKKRAHPLQHLLAGGIAGFVESSCCHPLDTIKTRMQLHYQKKLTVGVVLDRTKTPPRSYCGRVPLLKQQSRMACTRVALSLPESSGRPLSAGLMGTTRAIIENEGPFALYKGLTAVYTGIIPKMAIRFVSFEYYRDFISTASCFQATTCTFAAGLASGITEALIVVTPAEVCKIRMQAQDHSLVKASNQMSPKYTNLTQTATTIIKEEGVFALYKGVVPTMMRQGCNQAANFTSYSYLKRLWLERQQSNNGSPELQPFQHLLLGGISGGIGPTLNNPLDVVKTRMQTQVILQGQSVRYTGLLQSCIIIAKEEGVSVLWKGLTPRLLRIIPGQAITFMTYEVVSKQLHTFGNTVAET